FRAAPMPPASVVPQMALAAEVAQVLESEEWVAFRPFGDPTRRAVGNLGAQHLPEQEGRLVVRQWNETVALERVAGVGPAGHQETHAACTARHGCQSYEQLLPLVVRFVEVFYEEEERRRAGQGGRDGFHDSRGVDGS